MKKYTIGLITGALLAVSAMMCMGAKNKNLGDITVNSITVKDDGNGGFISVSNSDGKEKIYLGTHKSVFSGSLKIHESNGKKIIYLGNDKAGFGVYTFYERTKPTGFIGSQGSTGKVVLYSNSRVGWSQSGR